ncbi:serine hydrolase [Luteolibacter sp. GHJ8]|uniref:Serine hydrolase n=1 Tax=Luteolibacter rhizosphaerae TaxID=2989719 RepID=A0ABT3FXE7_9BACT|nr:serine hydrolase [Luteolibacter rhizosphaerae]MCW1912261.1 serine hydrolase [Luteolibacter rhizosphaerae]
MKALLLLLIALSPLGKLSAREPWITLTGLTEDQVNSRVGTFSNRQLGVVPEQISGYVESGNVRFAALWGPRPDSFSRRVLLGMTEAQLISNNNQLQQLGWRMYWINGYDNGGTPHFNAIYRLSNGAAQVLRLGDSLSQHQSADSAMDDTHYLENLCVYREGNLVKYAAVWNQSAFQPQISVSYGLTGEELSTNVANRQSEWRLHNLCGYSLPLVPIGESRLRYTVVWKKPARSTIFGVIAAMTKDNFFATDSNQTGVGWRTAFLQAWNNGDEVVVNAQWVPNGGLKQSYINRIDTLVRDAMEDGEIPAVSLAVARQGRIVFKRAYGLADTATNEWAGTDHRFRVASVSKAITGVSVVHALAGQTTWNLNSRVFGSGNLFGTDYGTAPYSTNESNITVRNLLHHTAGWSDDGLLWYHDEPAWGSQHKPFIDWQLQNRIVANTPGTVGRYSNLGFTIAARVVEKISGDSYETYTRNEIFDPCGISPILGPLVGERTKAQKKLMEVSYYPTTSQTFDPYLIDPRRMDGSTAWIARPADLLLMARRVDGDTRFQDILSADRVTALHTRGSPNSSSGYGWETHGLGWYTDNYADPDYWGHNGSMAGTRAELISRPRATSYSWVANARAGVSNSALDTIFNDITANSDWPDIDLSGTYHPAYNAWAADHFTGVERNDGLEMVLWGPDADPDDDRLPNAAEYFLGLDPRVGNRSPFSTTVVGSNLRIRWQKKNGIAGATMDLQSSTGLNVWSGFNQPEIVDRTDLLSQVGYTVQEVLIPMNLPKRFARFNFEIR